MNKDLSGMIYEMLKHRIGEKVNCKVWEAGEEKIYSGELMSVVPFDFINVDNRIISFVGTTHAIEEITLASNGKLVYVNPPVRGYQGFFERDFWGLIGAQEEYLGHSIIMEKMSKKHDGKSI